MATAQKNKRSSAIGIDLGTTNCCVGYLNPNNNVVEIIENQEGSRTTPSWVYFSDHTEIVGQAAKSKASRSPENVVYDIKRIIGKKIDDPFLDLKQTYKWPFKIISSTDNVPLIRINRNGQTEKYKLQDISAILLKYLKLIAEERLDTEVKDAVITVPAHFNYHQRTATKEAGELAGLNVLKIINEPTAAALAYIHKNEISGNNTNVLVFDLGGGTFDVSIVNVQGKSVTVKATAGNTALGGRDFDNNLSQFIADKIKTQHNKEIKPNTTAMRRIREKAETLKYRLSFDVKTDLDLYSLIDDEDVHLEITRTNFDQINEQLFQQCINTVQDCLKDAQLIKTEIDKIVLVGGSTRIPKIQEMLMEFFYGKQLTKAINPDEAVAYGAAVQAAMFNKGDKTEDNYVVNDITPLSLGSETHGDLMCVMIPRNSKIPISKAKRFLTVGNKQKIIATNIYEGERSLVEHNTLIGSTKLKLPPKPPGYPIDITFLVNANGILEVSSKAADGVYHNLTIQYEKHKIKTVNDVLTDAANNKTKDTKIVNIIRKYCQVEEYSTKMEALCDYDKKGIREEEKNTIRNVCQDITGWLAENTVKDGSPQEESIILNKLKETESVCEPIVNSYGYYVKDMCLSDFCCVSFYLCFCITFTVCPFLCIFKRKFITYYTTLNNNAIFHV